MNARERAAKRAGNPPAPRETVPMGQEEQATRQAMTDWLMLFQLFRIARYAGYAAALAAFVLKGLPAALACLVFAHIAGRMSPLPTEELDRYTGRKRAGH